MINSSSQQLFSALEILGHWFLGFVNLSFSVFFHSSLSWDCGLWELVVLPQSCTLGAGIVHYPKMAVEAAPLFTSSLPSDVTVHQGESWGAEWTGWSWLLIRCGSYCQKWMTGYWSDSFKEWSESSADIGKSRICEAYGQTLKGIHAAPVNMPPPTLCFGFLNLATAYSVQITPWPMGWIQDVWRCSYTLITYMLHSHITIYCKLLTSVMGIMLGRNTHPLWFCQTNCLFLQPHWRFLEISLQAPIRVILSSLPVLFRFTT